MDYILHPGNFQRLPFHGKKLMNLLQRQASIVAEETSVMPDPNISVVIRTKNDMAYIKQLFADIEAQVFNGKVEIILVDTCSSDGTVEFAKAQGAKVISISQQDFSYPRALNLGFRAAKHPYILTLVGHSGLSNTMMFKLATKWSRTENFGGLFDFGLPNWDASWAERWLSALGHAQFLKGSKVIARPSMGILAANSALISRKVWQELGGFDEGYAAGGEDSALGIKMLEAGLLVVREPVCSVYHTHGLGVIRLVKQLRYWRQLGKPVPFTASQLHTFRADLKRKA